jgi:4-hydroxy-tetrahydrodipicolinate synthase
LALDADLSLGSGTPAMVARRSRRTPEEVKAQIRGPILTLPTPFTRQFAVDYAAVRKIAQQGLANGIQVYELTAGNSQYHALSFEEIKKLTRVLVEMVAGRGIVIAATGPWWTGRAVEYARYADSVGADALQVLLPPASDDGYVEHFRQIAAATPRAIVLQGDPSPALIRRLIEIPSIVAMKEDGSDEYYPEIVKQFGDRLAIFCGGQKRRYLLAQPYGSPAFFSFFVTFAPEVTLRFWHAVQRNDMEAARAVVTQYEKPVFDFCQAGPRPFHAYWRALLEYFGVARRYVRPPEESCTDADMEKVRALCDRLGLKPAEKR